MKNNYYFNFIKNEGFESVILSYKDEKNTIEAKIAPKEGCNLYSLKYNDSDFIYSNKELLLADFVQGNPVLFPFPNRINDAMYTWEGKTYLQKKNGIPIQLHSLVYDEKSWEYEEPIINEDGILLKCFINIDKKHPVYQGYPFECKLTLNFKLSNKGLELEYIIENNDEKNMPFGFAVHPYFNRLDGDDGTKIAVPANKYYEVREDTDIVFLNKFKGGYELLNNVMPTGKLLDVEKGITDLENEISVGCLNLDHVYKKLDEDAHPYINYTKRKIKLNIISTEDMKHYVVYVPKNESYFCLEPQTCSTDAINLYNKGYEHVNLLILSSGEKHIGSIKFFIETY